MIIIAPCPVTGHTQNCLVQLLLTFATWDLHLQSDTKHIHDPQSRESWRELHTLHTLWYTASGTICRKTGGEILPGWSPGHFHRFGGLLCKREEGGMDELEEGETSGHCKSRISLHHVLRTRHYTFIEEQFSLPSWIYK